MNVKYAQLLDRVKAAVIDGIILIAMTYGVSELFLLVNEVSQSVRITAFIILFVLYDPVLTSAFGGTIGHSKIGIKVKRESNPE